MTVKKKIASVPFPPSEVFLKWIEFAANNGDLSELNLAGADMNVFEYHSLDVVLPLVAVTIVILGLSLMAAVIVLRWLKSLCSLSFVFRRTSASKNKAE